MLVKKSELKTQLKTNAPKLKKILEIWQNAPQEFKKNAKHLSSMSTLLSYVYYAALVEKYSVRNATVLDWGAFLGQVTFLLQDTFSVEAFNPQKDEAIDYWQKQLGIKNVSFNKTPDNFKLNLDKNAYDVVISSGVLEHTFEFGIQDIEALKELNIAMKPNGVLFIWNLPAKYALAEFVDSTKKRWRHIVKYGFDEILYKLNLCGFDVIAIERNEMVFGKLTKLFKPVNIADLWYIDNAFCRIPIIKNLAHHFTIVAKKIEYFPITPATSGYTTYAAI
jgi:2-polyprenyl-3-methyl-5-hydroxy-6-metoxy-1,4-benzoquinol methylase